MFGQHSITTAQTSANLDILRNNKPHSSPSNTQPFSLFPPSPASTGGRLFLSANDPPQNTSSLATKASNLERSVPLSATAITTTTITTANTAPSVLIPSEGRITKGSVDNALPIFFAGAQQPTEQQRQQQPSDNQEQEFSMQQTESTAQNETEPNVEPSKADTTSKDDSNSSSNNDEIRTIKIFGFPPNLADTLRTHFEKYGRIDSSQHSPGNWLSILYASPASATAALKSNRMVIADSFMIGVILATTNLKPIPSKSVLATTTTPTPTKQQQQQQDHVYKSVRPVSDGVFADRSGSSKKKSSSSTITAGTGQAGVSVVGGATVMSSNRATIPQTTGWLGFFKDVLFG